MFDFDWSDYKNFTRDEFACTHCKKCEVTIELVDLLQVMRDEYRKPIFISSGYRCPAHPVEQVKDEPGEHTNGMAVDIVCYTQGALTLLDIALSLGVRRIGLHQKGRASNRYMHIGVGDKLTNIYPKSIWTY